MAPAVSFLLGMMTLCVFFLAPATARSYNVSDYGAMPDGRTDAANPFLNAWAAACSSTEPAAIYVPAGRFLISQATFKGPCKNNATRIFVDGTLVAPSTYCAVPNWLLFMAVRGLSIFGGTIDGQGQAFWACRKAGRRCPQGAMSLTVAKSKKVLISGLTSLNSELFHIAIFGSSSIQIQGATISAPAHSPNTDGIHIQKSSDVTVIDTSIETGDDCISIGEGTTNVWIEKVSCGPGHGISIGSLGGTPSEAGVQNITVTWVAFSGTENGLRIKTWGKPYAGYVKGVNFAHATMDNVQFPIVVDQNYCPYNSSGIKISQVAYTDIQGSSATEVALKFDCSASNPCSEIMMHNINLTYQNNQALTYCKNAHGITSGVMKPPGCIEYEISVLGHGSGL
ncbi:hypothetical protein OPV22_031097 [Ensete ventricosum]|uniref:Exopolygalacturonase n=1 Tax=Ensete ventricosum TaxID=4639 RepID=A0AAV8NZ32_ENSVE|nr:hypothetical protein OPV22_031097 [Ensete ventricosum]